MVQQPDAWREKKAGGEKKGRRGQCGREQSDDLSPIHTQGFPIKTAFPRCKRLLQIRWLQKFLFEDNIYHTCL